MLVYRGGIVKFVGVGIPLGFSDMVYMGGLGVALLWRFMTGSVEVPVTNHLGYMVVQV